MRYDVLTQSHTGLLLHLSQLETLPEQERATRGE